MNARSTKYFIFAVITLDVISNTAKDGFSGGAVTLVSFLVLWLLSICAAACVER